MEQNTKRQEFQNTNAKNIMGNHELFAQFLRGYSQLEILQEVRPEDIEDCTESLRPYVGVEFEGDSVKKIRLHDVPDVFIICLVEHKSQVDFDITFQLLKYMVGIWDMYRSRENQEKRRSSLKGFRYPLIIPIVYYEGTDRWTAAMHWKERVEFSEMFGQFIPDFTYRLVSLREYSAEQLLSKEEELSLVMFLNRVQTREDLDFSRLPEAQRKTLEQIVAKMPDAILRIVKEMIYHFGMKLNLPDEDVRRFVKNVEEKNMGELWANMEDIDIPKIKRELKEQARVEVERAKQQARAEVEQAKQQIRAEAEANARAKVEQATQQIKAEAEANARAKVELAKQQIKAEAEANAKAEVAQTKQEFVDSGVNMGIDMSEIRLICKKMAKKCEPIEIAQALECEPEQISEKISFVSQFAPDYDFDTVYEAWQKRLAE